ncbi:hypothetical protein M758_10G098800 [Ceratodon purpureus]|nr:hypothetical protein M758_10G098800 [Ceratodon purpureus]KAG0603508.1 hypothetical protein M758_10G098800 [Ceratodon purpureus]
MASIVDAGLPGNRKADSAQEGGGGASRSSSSLESQLQQAWLQSQLPKVQKRSVSAPLPGVFGEKGASPQSSAEVLVGPGVSGRGGDVGGLEKTYFHKTRGDTASEFLRKFSTPQLETISSKTNIPPPLESRNSASTFSDGLSESDSGSSAFNTSDGFSTDTQHTVKDSVFDAVDFEYYGSVSVDLAGETEPLALFLDDILTNEELEEEKGLVQQTSAYHAMEKEIADLLAPDSGADSLEDVNEYDRFWTNVEFAPTEDSGAYKAMAKEIADLLSPESTTLADGEPEVVNKEDVSISTEFPPSEEATALKLMERYTSMLSRHIKDVSGSNSDVDYRTWVTESDEIQFDDAWKSYLESSDQTSATAPVFDFNMVLRGTGGSNSSSLSVLASPTGTSMAELLYKCAFAVSQGKADDAAEYLAELQNQSSPHGTSVQRMAHYFMEALVAKMSGTGEELYTVITNNHPSDATIMKAYRVFVDNNPYIKICHFFAMKSALDAFEGASRVHIIHYGLQYGVEWPSLLQHLSLRPEGPPHIRMTGVDFPYPGFDPLKKINDTGQRIAKIAKMWGIPFEFRGLTGKWESFTARDFDLRTDEVLAVKTCYTHTIHDDCVLSGSPRELVLKRIRSLNPKVR